MVNLLNHFLSVPNATLLTTQSHPALSSPRPHGPNLRHSEKPTTEVEGDVAKVVCLKCETHMGRQVVSKKFNKTAWWVALQEFHGLSVVQALCAPWIFLKKLSLSNSQLDTSNGS